MFSIVGTFLVGCISGNSLNMLADCERQIRIEDIHGHKKSIGYPDIGAYAFPSLNVRFCNAGRVYNLMSMTVWVIVVLTSIGVSSVYYNFAATVISDIATDRGSVIHERSSIVGLLFPVLLMLVCLQDYSVMSRLAVVGNIAVAMGSLVVILGYIFDVTSTRNHFIAFQ
jgi:hypothetical protein